ncbi:hypothetical protein EHO57_13740 [Leptospira langatensis]|uniref:Uncharacterized protein n=1 Tax=Leptospira langatensis TaxID=2484983 RepID=A0A5R2AT45_9LEPT|nr:hypothetical protein [Leptospira langatensis]TGJ99821.1 hypothetical protein EHO57_13740 [Leptospira langatensis]
MTKIVFQFPTTRHEIDEAPGNFHSIPRVHDYVSFGPSESCGFVESITWGFREGFYPQIFIKLVKESPILQFIAEEQTGRIDIDEILERLNLEKDLHEPGNESWVAFQRCIEIIEDSSKEV